MAGRPSRSIVLLPFVLVALAASCGGDADGGPTAPLPQEPVLTTVTVTLSASSVTAGSSVTATAAGRDQNGAAMALGAVSWSTANGGVASVDASGVVTGLAAGATNVIASSGGRQGQSTLTVTPAPVTNVDASSSYVLARNNAKASLLDWPSFVAAGEHMKTARAVGDLDGDGTVDVAIAPGLFLEETASVPMRLFRGSAGGTAFTNVTGAWISGAVPNVNHARKIILGDYNADGRNDVFICAHGYDAPPFPGTTNVLLLSSGGTWSVANQSWSGTVGFSHGCASGDVDGDGDLDIFVTESRTGSYLLINGGVGNFTLSRSGVPQSINREAPVFTAELMDLDDDGFIDLAVGGDEQYQPTTIFWGNGTGAFTDARATPVPAVPGWPNVLNFAREDVDGDGVRDLVLGRTKGNAGDADFYRGYLVQVLKGTAGRTFTDVTSSAAGATNASAPSAIRDFENQPTWLEWLWVADYDGDGAPDLIASDGWQGGFWARNQAGVFGGWMAVGP